MSEFREPCSAHLGTVLSSTGLRRESSPTMCAECRKLSHRCQLIHCTSHYCILKFCLCVCIYCSTPINDMSVNPDGVHTAVACWDSTVKVYNILSAKRLAVREALLSPYRITCDCRLQGARLAVYPSLSDQTRPCLHSTSLNVTAIEWITTLLLYSVNNCVAGVERTPVISQISLLLQLWDVH